MVVSALLHAIIIIILLEKKKTWVVHVLWLFLCVGECLVVGQSHFKTFDNKFFTFTGRCQYLLARDCADRGFSVIIENVQVIFFKVQQLKKKLMD